MAVFSTNQNRQLYVLGVTKGGQTGAVKTSASAVTNVSDIYIGQDKEGCLYGVYKGAATVLRTDLIHPKSVMWGTKSAPEDMQVVLKSKKLELAAGTQLISGEDYILRINFYQFYGMSDEDIYQKYGAVHCTAAMTTNAAAAAAFWTELAYSLIKNFSREHTKVLEFSIGGHVITRATKVNGVIKLFYDNNGTETEATSNGVVTGATNIIINEVSQVSEWALGTKQLQNVLFEVIPTTVKDQDGNDFVWGTVTDNTYTGTGNQKTPTLTPVTNGYKIADLEYFCMGERGDQYRNILWPKSIPTTYLVDPTAEYYVLDIHYAYQGTCEDIQKSEKTITFVAPTKDLIEEIVGKITGNGKIDAAKISASTNYGEGGNSEGTAGDDDDDGNP